MAASRGNGSGFELDGRVGRELLAHSQTKAGLSRTLLTLSNAGMLKGFDGECNEASLKRQLTLISTHHANTQTPYGPLVQSIELGVHGLKAWEYLNPFAWLFHLSSLSVPFASIMRSICVPGRPLRLIIFADSMEPGNPFRPEKGRSVMCLYWCFADWPQWLLQRSFAWPIFSLIRDSILDTIDAGLGFLLRHVLRVFFSETGHSLSRGVHIPHPDGDFMVTAIFAGFLGDLAGHKEMTSCKGTSAIYCCLSCRNVVYKRAAQNDEVQLCCSDVTKFRLHTDADIHNIVDELARVYGTIPAKRFGEMETALGFNYEPHGLLLDRGLRGIYHPASHHIRDWMHTICQDGVANTHMAHCLIVLRDMCDISPERVQDFANLCHYPSKLGKLDKHAFSSKRLRKNTIVSFASTMLSMVMVFQMFLDKFVVSILPEHVAAFYLLSRIIGILRLGPEDSMEHCDTLRHLMSAHLESFIKLYGEDLKPKMHHLFHVLDGMIWVGRLLACFVTERKHRDVKRSALCVYRHLEHTVLVDLVNKSVQQVVEGRDLYAPTLLIKPSDCVVQGFSFRFSRCAVLRCGETSAGDLVITDERVVGRVIRFWLKVGEDSPVAELEAYEAVDADFRLQSLEHPRCVFVDIQSIRESLIWFTESCVTIRVAVSPTFL